MLTVILITLAAVCATLAAVVYILLLTMSRAEEQYRGETEEWKDEQNP